MMLKKFLKRFKAAPRGQNRRREPREQVEDGEVEIRGQTYRLNDWSPRAFMVKPCDIDCNITDRLEVTVRVRYPDKKIEFASRAIVVRIDKEGQELAAYFAMLDAAAKTAIADHFGDGTQTLDELLGGDE